MLPVCPRHLNPADSGGRENERTIMGNAAVVEELAGIDELEELYELNASEEEPEDDEDYDDEEEDEDEEEEEDEDGDGDEGMPSE
jgi:hypothetical protein